MDIRRQGDVIKSTHKFAFQIYNSLLKDKNQEKNIFYSPASIYAVLSMTYCGARGRTAEEIKEVMGLPIDKNEDEDKFHEAFGKTWHGIIKANCNDVVNLEIANRLWLQKGGEIETSFQEKLLKNYQADARSIDFSNDTESARKEINTWIEEKTKEKMKNLIPEGSLSPATRVLLTNALYFNAKWKNMFLEKKTTPMPFYTLDGKSLSVDMMCQKAHFGHGRFKEYDMEVLTVRYLDSTLNMIILLPNEKDGILKLEKLLHENSLKSEYIEDFPQRDRIRKIKLYLPKFKISQKNSMGEILKGLGMSKLFSPSDADLSGINKDNLYVNDVAHEAYCEVNETGTAAVAVTKSDMVTAGGPPPEFRVDHPFLFYIIDSDTDMILFSGRMCRPSYDD